MPKTNAQSTGVKSHRLKMLALKQSMATMKADMNPNVVSTPLRAHPAPNRTYGNQWVPRTYRAFKVQLNSSDAEIPFTIGDLVSAGCPTGTRFRSLRYKVWNSTSAGTSSGFIEVRFTGADTYSGVAPLTLSDQGTATFLPGIGVTLPKSLTTVATASTSSAVELFKFRASRPGVQLTHNQSITIDIQTEIAI